MAEDPYAQAYGLLAGLGPGARVAGYVIEERLGVGGMAVVYRARDEALERMAAIKFMAPTLAADEEFRLRFARESRAAASVNEPHIIPVYAAGEVNGVLYMATRFVPGGDLHGLLDRSGPLASDRAASIITQVASALDAAHEAGLVHRDVKPANILLDAGRGGADHAYLADFGLSKGVLSMTRLTSTGQFLGTPDYSSPEQINGYQTDGRGDQYALACVAFALLTGVPPFKRDQPMTTLVAHLNDPPPSAVAFRPSLPNAVDPVLARAMAKVPSRRYGSCGEFADALRYALLAPGQFAAPGGWQGSDDPATFSGWHQKTAAAGPPAPMAIPPRPQALAGRGVLHSATAVNGSAMSYREEARKAPRRRKTTGIIGAAAVLTVAAVVVAITVPKSHPNSHPNSGLPPLHAGTPVQVGTLNVPTGGNVEDGILSQDGTLFAAATFYGASTGNIYVWNVAKRAYLTTLTAPKGPLQFFFSSDDKTLVAVDDGNNSIYRFDLSTGRRFLIRTINARQTWSISSDASTLAVEDPAGDAIDLWNLSTGSRVAHLVEPVTTPIADFGISLDGDGQRVAVSDTSGKTYVWDVSAKKVIATFSYNYVSDIKGASPSTPVLSPDGETLYVPDNGPGPATLWDVATQANITPQDPRWPPQDAMGGVVLFSTDGRVACTLYSANWDLWDVATHSHLLSMKAEDGSSLLAVGPDDSEVVITSPDDEQLYVWDIPMGSAKPVGS